MLYEFIFFSTDTLNTFLVLLLDTRVRFLFGGRHGEFRFLPPPGFAPCSESLLPKVKLIIEPCQKYTLDHGEGKQDLIGPLVPLTPVTFTPTPVDISKVNIIFFPPNFVTEEILSFVFNQFKFVSVLYYSHRWHCLRNLRTSERKWQKISMNCGQWTRLTLDGHMDL